MKSDEKCALTTTETELQAEEPEAPGVSLNNHNETFVVGQVELEAEELERIIAPAMGANHNEAFLAGQAELEAAAAW